MGINKKVIVGIMLVIFFTTASNNIFYGYEKDNSSFINEILKVVEVSTKEYKATGSFVTNKTENEVYIEIVKALESLVGQVNINSEDKNKFIICDGKEELNVELTILPYKDENNVTLSISLYGEDLTIDKKDKLETKIKRILSIFDSNVEYSLCVKSEIINNTMDEVRNIINDNLSLFHAKNTDEVKINNGYSIIGYTGLNNKRTILGKDIDFNCAIVKYSSGCYLIMGEPEITITY